MTQRQIGIPATYMRGGTSKGVFFSLTDLPDYAQIAGEKRDALLLRVIGSPDPYAKHTDGMGGATSSTSKVVILSATDKPNHHVNYLFGQVAIDKPAIDWSGNCGNLTAAVGAFAIRNGLVPKSVVPHDGIAEIHIWQQNISKTIIAYVPIVDGEVQELGDFELDGVTFPAAEVKIEFVEPVDPTEAVFPTGNVVDDLIVEGEETLQATMISAGIPTVFVRADQLGFDGCELQDDINGDPAILARFEKIRTAGAIAMGLITSPEEAKTRQHTPKVAIVAAPKSYLASSGKSVSEREIDINVRALSMGKLHHAMMGTAAVAIGAACSIPGTLLNTIVAKDNVRSVTFGHPSGTLSVGAQVTVNAQGRWQVDSVTMSRSARVLMEGKVFVPQP